MLRAPRPVEVVSAGGRRLRLTGEGGKSGTHSLTTFSTTAAILPSTRGRKLGNVLPPHGLVGSRHSDVTLPARRPLPAKQWLGYFIF